MSYAEAQYVIDEVSGAMADDQATGLPPDEFEWYIRPGTTVFDVRVTPTDTIIQNQLLCRVGGIVICARHDHVPEGPDDYTMRKELIRGYEGATSGPSNPTKQAMTINAINTVTFEIPPDVKTYVRLFPYSDHGVYNTSDYYSDTTENKSVWIYGFEEKFMDLNPDTRITYIEQNANFQPAYYDYTEGVDAFNYGSWKRWPWLIQNKPYLVDTITGKAIAELDSEDYTKKADGTASNILTSTSNHIGCYSWIPKFYYKEVFQKVSADANGNSGYSNYPYTRRTVHFSNTNSINETSDYDLHPAFYDANGNEIDGFWLPMFYTNQECQSMPYGKVLSTWYMSLNASTISSKYGYNFTSPTQVNAYMQPAWMYEVVVKNYRGHKKTLDTDGKSAFYGGHFHDAISLILVLLSKSTNIESKFGYGITNHVVSSQTDRDNKYVNKIVNGGAFYGSASNKSEHNKIFHSIVIGSYLFSPIDIYFKAFTGNGYGKRQICPYNKINVAYYVNRTEGYLRAQTDYETDIEILIYQPTNTGSYGALVFPFCYTFTPYSQTKKLISIYQYGTSYGGLPEASLSTGLCSSMLINHTSSTNILAVGTLFNKSYTNQYGGFFSVHTLNSVQFNHDTNINNYSTMGALILCPHTLPPSNYTPN